MCHKLKAPNHLISVNFNRTEQLDSRPRGCGPEPHQRHCVVSLSKNINPSLVLVQPRKTRPFITERLLMGCKRSNQTNKQKRTEQPVSKKGKNCVKILPMISKIEFDLCFTMLYPSANFE